MKLYIFVLCIMSNQKMLLKSVRLNALLGWEWTMLTYSVCVLVYVFLLLTKIGKIFSAIIKILWIILFFIVYYLLLLMTCSWRKGVKHSLGVEWTYWKDKTSLAETIPTNRSLLLRIATCKHDIECWFRVTAVHGTRQLQEIIFRFCFQNFI